MVGSTYTVRLRYSSSCRTAWSQVRVRGAVGGAGGRRQNEAPLLCMKATGSTALP
ncbi:DUF2690 domain-containing protein [Streptomyces xiamenensis]